ncbi:MAG: DUF3578 domain-containing protein [Bacteroidetes bacterium]|nr:DUF3578 domain-containing protein [Bacteroidota bacterium]
MAIKVLNNLNFDVIEREDSYYEELTEFIIQSQTNELKYSKYLKKFFELEVKVSFGQGGVANIPWISFLREGVTTSNGIYPVYLFFKKENILVLAYGISETNQPVYNWSLSNSQTIENYFIQKGLGTPFRYGKSFVYRVYDVKSLPNKKVINNDLLELLKYYKSLNLNLNMKSIHNEIIDFNLESFYEILDLAGLIFSPQLIQRFVASLCTKPFVICSGLSGSGKTKLAQAFAQWITADESQYAIVPVGADWTNREPLLGYPNALSKEEYVSPENGVLDLMIRAKENIENKEEQTKPYFLILDEMNLSHVERYFADFLSTMESGDQIPLHKIENDDLNIPQSIKLPKIYS